MPKSENKHPRYLITGGAGFIGLRFLKHLISLQPMSEIVVIDKLGYGSQKKELLNLVSESKVKFIEGDISNIELVAQCIDGVDYVFNFAAESHVDRSIEDSLPFVLSNAYGVQVLLEAALKSKVKTFIQISTDEVYGTIDAGSWTERSPLLPNSPYAASKASGDLLALAFSRTHGMDIRITRCSNNYGPGQNPEKLIPKAITKILANEDIGIYGTGENIREWIHVDDHCKGIWLVFTSGSRGEIYNIGSGIEKTNNEVVDFLIKLTKGKYKGTIKLIADRKGHDSRYSLDFTKIINLGFTPKIDFEEGLRTTFEWYSSVQE